MTKIEPLFRTEDETILATANAMCVSLGLANGADIEDLIQQIDFELDWSGKNARVLARARKAIIAFHAKKPRRRGPSPELTGARVLSLLLLKGRKRRLISVLC
jgi:hypothetical protein